MPYCALLGVVASLVLPQVLALKVSLTVIPHMTVHCSYAMHTMHSSSWGQGINQGHLQVLVSRN
jgi:hypothetical protein